MRSSWNAFNTKDFTNGKEPTKTLRIQRLDSSVRKPRGNDIYSSNPYGNQATHFISCIENPNAPNSSCNCKKIGNTSKVGLIMCISFANKGETQVGWVVTIRQRT
jgi:hypothetical protein